MNLARDDDANVVYIDPAAQIYVGLWILFGGATVFLALRLWVKLTRRHGLWYDDYILLLAYVSYSQCCDTSAGAQVIGANMVPCSLFS